MMREMVAGLVFIWLAAVTFYPENVGRAAHKTWNDIRAGWQQVQDK